MYKQSTNVTKGVIAGVLAGAAIGAASTVMVKNNKNKLKKTANKAMRGVSSIISDMENMIRG